MTGDDIRRILDIGEPIPENGFRHYSVLIPLIEMDDDIHVLYEVRARDLDRQPGEICFPGGEVEDGESFADCAIRETEEEIGISGDRIDVIGELTTIYGIGKFAMHCFTGLVGPKAMDSLKLNEEVDDVFTVPLGKLLATDVEMFHAHVLQKGPDDFPYMRVTGEESYEWSRFTSPVPVYDVGEHVIWGLTGRATRVLLELIARS